MASPTEWPSEHPVIEIAKPLEDHMSEEEWHREWKKLKRPHKEPDAIDIDNMSPQELDAYYTALVTGVFKLIGLDPKEHVSCFHACVAKCKSTNVLTAETWSGWEGYKDVKEKMRYIVRRTEATGRYHLLNAPSLVAAIAVKSMRRIITNSEDEVTKFLIKYKTFDFAAVSVENYTRTNKPIIQTTEPYPRAGESIQEPDELEHQMISGTIGVEEYFKLKYEECQQSEVPYAKARQQTPPPDIVTTVTHTMTRTQAIEVVEPLVQRISQEPWQPDLNDELGSKLTEETVAVLPPSTKVWLDTWARQSGKPIILEWLERFAEDKSTHEWTETRRIPGPAMWSFTSPAHTWLDDLFYLAEHADLNREMARRKMKATTAALQLYVDDMEERYEFQAKELKAKAEALAAMKEEMQQAEEARTDTTNKINALQDAIVAMQQEMQKLQLSI